MREETGIKHRSPLWPNLWPRGRETTRLSYCESTQNLRHANGRTLLAGLITQRSKVQILPPQPTPSQIIVSTR